MLITTITIIVSIIILALIAKSANIENIKRDNYKIKTTKYNFNNRTSDKYKIQKGKEYENKIQKIYESIGYKVFPNGKVKGFKDGGIDLIAWADDEVVLIQCKNHEREIKQILLKKFYADAMSYERKNANIIKNRKITREFISNSALDYGAKMWLKENEGVINFRIIQD